MYIPQLMAAVQFKPNIQQQVDKRKFRISSNKKISPPFLQ